jgi:hypothetical protein
MSGALSMRSFEPLSRTAGEVRVDRASDATVRAAAENPLRRPPSPCPLPPAGGGRGLIGAVHCLQRIRRLALTLGAALLVALALGGCGKRNLPTPPPGEPVTYPRIYPSV